MTITAAPPVSPDATDYLLVAWWDQPRDAAATDRAYVEWERQWDWLCTDAEQGVAAALEAVDVIDAEVRATIRRLRAEVKAA